MKPIDQKREKLWWLVVIAVYKHVFADMALATGVYTKNPIFPFLPWLRESGGFGVLCGDCAIRRSEGATLNTFLTPRELLPNLYQMYLPLSRKISHTTFLFTKSLSIDLIFWGGSRWSRGAFRRRRLEVHNCNMNHKKKRKLCTTYMLFVISADFMLSSFFVRNLEHNGHMLVISNPVLFLRHGLVDQVTWEGGCSL